MPDPVLVLFGQNIRRERIARQWSQTDLAHKAGITQHGVYAYEKAKNEAGVLSALRIADALGLSLDSMLAPPSCGTCKAKPRRGFRCLECGRESAP